MDNSIMQHEQTWISRMLFILILLCIGYKSAKNAYMCELWILSYLYGTAYNITCRILNYKKAINTTSKIMLLDFYEIKYAWIAYSSQSIACLMRVLSFDCSEVISLCPTALSQSDMLRNFSLQAWLKWWRWSPRTGFISFTTAEGLLRACEVVYSHDYIDCNCFGFETCQITREYRLYTPCGGLKLQSGLQHTKALRVITSDPLCLILFNLFHCSILSTLPNSD